MVNIMKALYVIGLSGLLSACQSTPEPDIMPNDPYYAPITAENCRGWLNLSGRYGK